MKANLAPLAMELATQGSVPSPLSIKVILLKFFAKAVSGLILILADIQLPSAVVGDDRAIHSQLDGLFSVLGIDDPLTTSLPFQRSRMAEILLRSAPGEGLVHEKSEVFHTETLGDVGLVVLNSGIPAKSCPKDQLGQVVICRCCGDSFWAGWKGRCGSPSVASQSRGIGKMTRVGNPAVVAVSLSRRSSSVGW